MLKLCVFMSHLLYLLSNSNKTHNILLLGLACANADFVDLHVCTV